MTTKTLKPVWRLMSFYPQTQNPNDAHGLVEKIGDRPVTPIMVAVFRLWTVREQIGGAA